MRAVVPQLFFVLIVLNVGNVRIDKERVALESALKEQNFLFLQIDRFELLETGGKVSLLLDFRLLHIFRLTLLLSFNFPLPIPLILMFLLDLLLDVQVGLLLAGVDADGFVER